MYLTIHNKIRFTIQKNQKMIHDSKYSKYNLEIHNNI